MSALVARSASAGAGGGRPFVLGLAEEDQSGFSAEVMHGVEAAASELGWRHLRVNDAQQEQSCDVLLAIGNVRLFPDLLRREKAAVRVLWHGETLPRPTGESGGPIHSLLPTGRMLDTVFAVAPGSDRVRALRDGREKAALVREPLANLRLLQRALPAFDRIVVDSHDRAEGALRAGLRVSVVPTVITRVTRGHSRPRAIVRGMHCFLRTWSGSTAGANDWSGSSSASLLSVASSSTV